MGKHFLWDPVEDNIVKEIDDAGTTIADYTTEPNLYGDLISQHRDGQYSFYHYDGQGSTTSLTSANAEVTDTYTYSAFGEVTSHTGSTVNPFKYIGLKGYYLDIESEGYDVRRRLLQVNSSRWLSVDPFSSVDTSFGHYIYSRNNPISYVDPSGRQVKANPGWAPTILRIITKFIEPIVTGQTNPNAECGQIVARVTFTIEKAPCAGYLIQHITVKRHIQGCEPHDKCPGEIQKGDVIQDFYEMFPFNPPHTSVWPIGGKVEKTDTRINQGGRAEQQKTGKPNCGKFSVNGDIRFYCKVGDDDPDKWEVGGGGSSGTLPSKREQPGFWTNDPDAKGSAFNSHWWCCCAEPKIHSRDVFIEDSSGGRTVDIPR